MRFQVPQFIGVEDTIFGPFTAKQFVYVTGGVALSYIAYKFLPLVFAIIVIAPMVLLSASLAFVKINGKPFIFTLEAGLKYFVSSKIYLWKKIEQSQNINMNIPSNIPKMVSPKNIKEGANGLDNLLDLTGQGKK
jgi:hypothetical protein